LYFILTHKNHILYNNEKIKTIEKVESSEIDEAEIESKPSLIIYFIQPEDTLWKIGKKFNVPIEQLAKVNCIPSQEQMLAGQQILIPKKHMKKSYIKK
jgi:LysM repeat protein